MSQPVSSKGPVSPPASSSKPALHWIGGEWVDSEGHKDSINPATSEVIGSYAVGTEKEAEQAVQAALKAFRETDWRTNRDLRVRALNDLADRFEARGPELIEAIALENGKIKPEAGFEVQLAVSGFRFGAALVLANYGRAAEWEGGKISVLLREPMGVAAVSTPWNSPLALLIRSLAPALAAGCTTVLKGSNETAQTNALICDIISDVKSLPVGVVNSVTGGHEVLSSLMASPDVPTISFTGSTKTGRSLTHQGADLLKRIGTELGGKTPILVFDDADIDAAVPRIEKALTTFAGQFCMTGSRLLVQRGVADALRERLAARFPQIKVGPAADPSSEMGPMIDIPNVQRVDKMVEDAIAAGAKVVARGGPFGDGPLSKGAFYQPCLLEVSDPKLDIVQQEVFGPVLTMMVFDTEREAVTLANDSEYGLSASVWSRDVDRPLRIAREIDAGTIWVNDWVVMRDEFEEGGYKQSGRGRLRGLAALDDFTEYKHIVLQPGIASR